MVHPISKFHHKFRVSYTASSKKNATKKPVDQLTSLSIFALSAWDICWLAFSCCCNPTLGAGVMQSWAIWPRPPHFVHTVVFVMFWFSGRNHSLSLSTSVKQSVSRFATERFAGGQDTHAGLQWSFMFLFCVNQRSSVIYEMRHVLDFSFCE